MKYRLPLELLFGIICTIGIGIGINTVVTTVSNNTASWKTIIDPTFGIVISYPQGLTLTGVPLDIAKAKKEYDAYCQTHEGCSGTRWPEYAINFQTEEGMSVFILDIHQIPVRYALGGIEHDGFTFAIRRPYNIFFFKTKKDIAKQHISEKELLLIQKNLSFITPATPLSCLWNETTIGLPANYRSIEEYKGKIASASGYFFNKNTNVCEKTIYDTWVYEVKTTSPPFTSHNYCEAVCKR